MSVRRSFCFLSSVVFCLAVINRALGNKEVCEQDGIFILIIAGTFKASFDSLTGCSGGSCRLKMGTFVYAKVTITPKVPSKSIHVDALASWLFLSFKIDGVPVDGCKIPGVTCPWPANKTLKITIKVPVPHLPWEVIRTLKNLADWILKNKGFKRKKPADRLFWG
ncbi:hypothetical protein RF11_12704 [Thelohanellus kitauei]|uniref:MD-2-related lipid-recognition domain-containing protein n=1 Tax=Thelohanellus kitauei TaxID=669202 RepID=A0A0C2MHV7_THEKT|nr:hypothetical protein RF11_12704 [Thelohanellus kitauei]